MIRTFLVLPLDAAPAESDLAAYLESQQPLPVSDDDPSAAIRSTVEAWNRQVVLAGRGEALIRCDPAGTIVRVRIPHQFLARVLPLLRDHARPAAFYDADRRTLHRFGPRRPATLRIDDHPVARTIALDELRSYIETLTTPQVLTVTKPDEDPATFIQTYPTPPEPTETPTYTVEISDASAARRYRTRLDTPTIVADLIWDWLDARWNRLYQHTWRLDPSARDTHLP
ncbi:hypothetical protein ACWDSJ_28490 [Nocardia sp. NPDC003482]